MNCTRCNHPLARHVSVGCLHRDENEELCPCNASHGVAPEVPPRRDEISSPAHYVDLGAKCDHCGNPVEPIVITERLPGNRSNAVKYLCRAGKKAGSDELKDLRKAAWYISREIKRVEKEKT